MVNLEEITGDNKRFYEPPQMTIKRIDFSDILTTSGGDPTTYYPEGPNAAVGNDTDAEDETIGGG